MPNSVLTYSPRDPAAFPNWTFEHLDVDYDAASQSVWMSYKASSPPHYTLQTLTDMADVRESLRLLFQSDEARSRWPIRYFVHASDKAGVFSLGGDLATFAASIRKRDHETPAPLRLCVHRCDLWSGDELRAADRHGLRHSRPVPRGRFRGGADGRFPHRRGACEARCAGGRVQHVSGNGRRDAADEAAWLRARP